MCAGSIRVSLLPAVALSHPVTNHRPPPLQKLNPTSASRPLASPARQYHHMPPPPGPQFPRNPCSRGIVSLCPGTVVENPSSTTHSKHTLPSRERSTDPQLHLSLSLPPSCVSPSFDTTWNPITTPGIPPSSSDTRGTPAHTTNRAPTPP